MPQFSLDDLPFLQQVNGLADTIADSFFAEEKESKKRSRSDAEEGSLKRQKSSVDVSQPLFTPFQQSFTLGSIQAQSKTTIMHSGVMDVVWRMPSGDKAFLSFGTELTTLCANQRRHDELVGGQSFTETLHRLGCQTDKLTIGTAVISLTSIQTPVAQLTIEEYTQLYNKLQLLDKGKPIYGLQQAHGKDIEIYYLAATIYQNYLTVYRSQTTKDIKAALNQQIQNLEAQGISFAWLTKEYLAQALKMANIFVGIKLLVLCQSKFEHALNKDKGKAPHKTWCHPQFISETTEFKKLFKKADIAPLGIALQTLRQQVPESVPGTIYGVWKTQLHPLLKNMATVVEFLQSNTQLRAQATLDNGMSDSTSTTSTSTTTTSARTEPALMPSTSIVDLSISADVSSSLPLSSSAPSLTTATTTGSLPLVRVASQPALDVSGEGASPKITMSADQFSQLVSAAARGGAEAGAKAVLEGLPRVTAVMGGEAGTSAPAPFFQQPLKRANASMDLTAYATNGQSQPSATSSVPPPPPLMPTGPLTKPLTPEEIAMAQKKAAHAAALKKQLTALTRGTKSLKEAAAAVEGISLELLEDFKKRVFVLIDEVRDDNDEAKLRHKEMQAIGKVIAADLQTAINGFVTNPVSCGVEAIEGVLGAILKKYEIQFARPTVSIGAKSLSAAGRAAGHNRRQQREETEMDRWIKRFNDEIKEYLATLSPDTTTSSTADAAPQNKRQ